MWLDVFKWPEMIKYKQERDDQFAGTEGMFDQKFVKNRLDLNDLPTPNNLAVRFLWREFIFRKTSKP